MEKSEHIRQLIADGIMLLEEKYGDRSDTPLAYHNKEHAYDVMDATQSIGSEALQQGKITESDLALLELAACYHDAEHGMHGSDNEYESIRIVTNKMKKAGVFSNDDITKVTEMIEATIVNFKKGMFTQSVDENYYTKIIADADMSALGKPLDIFWDRSKKLLRESDNRIFDSQELKEKIAFISSQITFLQQHTYHTSEADMLYGNKQETIKSLQNVIQQYNS
jgi:predicted metal-dependent HD superfamily phosphohydrolase